MNLEEEKKVCLDCANLRGTVGYRREFMYVSYESIEYNNWFFIQFLRSVFN